MPKILSLYLDESGSRKPDKGMPTSRHGRDFFAIGGYIINEEDEQAARDAHAEFCAKWSITYPLHSVEIRNKTQKFVWMQSSNRLSEFYDDIRAMIKKCPVKALACVVDRPGYNTRYAEKYKGQRWPLCKSAFPIAVERAARIAMAEGRKLRVYHEACGKVEDNALRAYFAELKKDGMPFDKGTSSTYAGLDGAAFTRSLYDFKTKQKSSPMMQIADLLLHPIGVSAYDVEHLPFCQLWEDEKLIDCGLTWDQRTTNGTKYYCFQDLTERTPKRFLKS